jgi:hypothetical protein
VCFWGAIRVRLPGTVACIVHVVHPPDGRQIERPTSRGSIPGKGERCILEVSSSVQIASG